MKITAAKIKSLAKAEDEAALQEIADEAELGKKFKNTSFDSFEEAGAWLIEKLELEDAAEEKPAKKGGLNIGKKKAAEAEEYTYEQVMAMDGDELQAVIEEKELEVSGKFDTVEEAAAAVAEAMGLEEEKPAKKGGLTILGKKKGKEEESGDDLPSFDDVHELEESDLIKLAQKHKLKIADESFNDLSEAADWVCEQLEIEAPKKKGGLNIGKKK